ncbi:MAG TPA: hypothetical protein VFV87_20890, partial [Pirellulaceae bacterium]|nr:hypothetical protein [Pirellulaceae bacterium]
CGEFSIPWSLHMASRFVCVGILLVAALLGADSLPAQEQPPGEDAQRNKRLTLMENSIAALEARSDEIRDKSVLTFTAKPLLRYNDPTREYVANLLLDATVWRLGESGRPTALVTLEMYSGSGKEGLLSFEFASLTNAGFSLRHKANENVAWRATGSAVKMSPLAEAPPPAKSAAGRLAQMRRLARDFKVHERLGDGQTVECRLLAQPINRYTSAADKISDGAIFAFANGTNPELGLLLECDDQRWSYGAVRLSSAELTLALGDRELVKFQPGDFRATSGTYSAAHHPLKLAD